MRYVILGTLALLLIAGLILRPTMGKIHFSRAARQVTSYPCLVLQVPFYGEVQIAQEESGLRWYRFK